MSIFTWAGVSTVTWPRVSAVELAVSTRPLLFSVACTRASMWQTPVRLASVWSTVKTRLSVVSGSRTQVPLLRRLGGSTCQPVPNSNERYVLITDESTVTALPPPLRITTVTFQSSLCPRVTLGCHARTRTIDSVAGS